LILMHFTNPLQVDRPVNNQPKKKATNRVAFFFAIFQSANLQ
jgi:hypothetical protein